MNNYKLIYKGLLVTSDPVIAAMFLEQEILFKKYEDSEWSSATLLVVDSDGVTVRADGVLYRRHLGDICISYHLVWEAIDPVEGKAVFIWPRHWTDKMQPNYRWDGDTRSLIKGYIDSEVEAIVSVNAITTGKTVGELRELAERCSAAPGGKDEVGKGV
jgi:hypothetical protein